MGAPSNHDSWVGLEHLDIENPQSVRVSLIQARLKLITRTGCLVVLEGRREVGGSYRGSYRSISS